MRLRLPYVSQLSPTAAHGVGDGGIAVVTALIHGATTARPTVDEVAQSINLPRGFPAATVRHLQRAATAYGVKLTATRRVDPDVIENALNHQHPVILLLSYPRLIHKFDPIFSMGHFVLVHGYDDHSFYYDDPYFPNATGADIAIPKGVLMQAWYALGEGAVALICRSHTFAPYDPDSRDIGDADESRALTVHGFTLQGMVKDAQGKGIADASVRLVGSQNPLGGVPNVIPAPPKGAVVWDHIVSGVFGNRFDMWDAHVKIQTGMPFNAFKDEVVVQNPALATDGFVFRRDKSYTMSRLASVVAWCHPVIGISGTRFEVFEKHIKEQVRGIGAEKFIADVVDINSTLKKDNFIFKADKIYRFPANLWGGTELRWTRKLTGFSGNRNDLWHAHVKDTVEGLIPQEFFREVERWNPTLETEDGHVLRQNKTYLLPENVPATLYYLLTRTDREGRYRFDGIPAGLYTLEVQGAGLPLHRERVTIDGAMARDVTLGKVAPPKEKEEDTPLPDKDDVTPAPVDFITMRNGNFLRKGNVFRFIGVNLRGIVHYGFPGFTDNAKAHHRTQALDEARTMGAKVVRVFLARRGVSTADTITRLKSTLDELRARGMLAIIAFQDAHGDTGFNVDGDTPFYTDDAEGKLGMNFYEREYRRHYLPFVKEVVNACKSDAAIMAWEIGNEFKVMTNKQATPDTGEKFIPFAHAVANEIHDIDPHHLIGTGIINSGSLALTAEQAARLYAHPHLHFLTVHVYGGGHPDYNATEAQQIEIQRMHSEAALARQLKKPYIIEEFGWFGGERQQKSRDFANDWMGNHGAAGFMQWGFMPFGDMGDGDKVFGMDKAFTDLNDYNGLFDIFKAWANRLG